jgi:type III pantothenate kinase
MRNSASPILAIDIGNSLIHVGLVDARARRCLRRFDPPLSAIRDRLPRVLDKAVLLGTKANSSVLRAVIAGGGKGMVLWIRALLREFDVTDVTDLAWHAGLPVRFRYKHPSRLGADRIADALYTAAAYPKRNAIIIDVGTAVTVDALTGNGDFIGGVIFPGPATQLQALHEAAPALPMVDLIKKTTALPGASTEECMRSGVVHSVAGGLDHLVRKFHEVLGGRCTVLSTGGGWNTVKGYVDFKSIEVADMTLIGTGLYFDGKSPGSLKG